MNETEACVTEMVEILASYNSGKTRAMWVCHLLNLLAEQTNNDPEHIICLEEIGRYIDVRLSDEDYLVILSPLPEPEEMPVEFPDPTKPQPGPSKIPWFDWRVP